MLNELLSWSTGHIVIGHDVPSRPGLAPINL